MQCQGQRQLGVVFCEAKYYSEPFTLQMIPAIREVKVKKPFKAGRLCA